MSDHTDVIIDAVDVDEGEYLLRLEYFDASAFSLGSTLKADTIQVLVVVPFVEFETASIVSGVPSAWTLEAIDPKTDLDEFSQILVEPNALIAPFIDFDPESYRLVYSGALITDLTRLTSVQIEVTIVDAAGMYSYSFFQQVILLPGETEPEEPAEE